MMTQTSHGEIFRGYQGSGYLEISAYRACNAVAFARDCEKSVIFDPPSRTASCEALALLSGADFCPGLRPGRLRFGFAAKQARFDRKRIQDEDGFVITTRPPKRGRSIT